MLFQRAVTINLGGNKSRLGNQHNVNIFKNES